MLAKFNSAMALEGHQVDLEVSAAHNIGHFIDGCGAHESSEGNASQRIAVEVGRAAAARRHDRVDFGFMVCIAADDGLDVVDAQIGSIKVDMKAAGSVDRRSGVGKGFGDGHGFREPLFAMQHRADDFKSAAHATVAHQFPVGTGRVVIGFIMHGDAHGAQRCQGGLAIDPGDFKFDSERAIHILQPHVLIYDSLLP